MKEVKTMSVQFLIDTKKNIHCFNIVHTVVYMLDEVTEARISSG